MLSRALAVRVSSLLVAVSVVSVPRVHAATPPRPAARLAPAVTVPAGWPKTLALPRFGVRASVESVAFSSTRDVHAPYRWDDVAWYNRGPRPGDWGRASVFGHLDSTCCPAVFWRLRSLRPGDIAQVAYKTGPVLRFRVMWQADYRNNQLPLKFMFGPARERGLILMTCSGVFHRDGTGYDHKLLVYARLLLPSGRLG